MTHCIKDLPVFACIYSFSDLSFFFWREAENATVSTAELRHDDAGGRKEQNRRPCAHFGVYALCGVAGRPATGIRSGTEVTEPLSGRLFVSFRDSRAQRTREDTNSVTERNPKLHG